MSPLGAPTVRVLGSHAAASLALSLPWPLLLVLVADHHRDPALLGVAGAARMLPYVALSWFAGRLADAFRRDTIVRVSLVLRLGLFVATGVALLADGVWLALGLSTAAVAVATPAYPALAAAMPGVAGPRRRQATDLLVTIEVVAFVAGAAIGGLLLNPATRELLPWVPLGLTVLALWVVLPVSMPAPVARAPGVVSGVPHHSGFAALRHSRAARRAVMVMAVINLVISAVGLALLPLALGDWGSDAAGYGLATGMFGLAALGAPLLRLVGVSGPGAVCRGLLVMAAALVLVAPATSVSWALPALALAGAAAVAVEASATGVLQETVPDAVRATVLGINDSVIVGAALVGSLASPPAVDLLGGSSVLVALSALVLLLAGCARPRALGHDQATAIVEDTRWEAHDPVPPGTPRTMGAAARHRTAQRQRLLGRR